MLVFASKPHVVWHLNSLVVSDFGIVNFSEQFILLILLINLLGTYSYLFFLSCRSLFFLRYSFWVISFISVVTSSLRGFFCLSFQWEFSKDSLIWLSWTINCLWQNGDSILTSGCQLFILESKNVFKNCYLPTFVSLKKRY